MSMLLRRPSNEPVGSSVGTEVTVRGGGVDPRLPVSRGPISEAVLNLITEDWPVDLRVLPDLEGWSDHFEPIVDDDFQLALHIIYELSYRGFDGVDDRWEWDPGVLDLRAQLEECFEASVRSLVASTNLVEQVQSVRDVLGRFNGPSLSRHMDSNGSLDEFREFAIHQSGYQLKEADPHRWGIPRFTGPRKAALVEIQADEYGKGRPGEAHADLFGGLMSSLDLDHAYGTYLDQIPGVTLATGNLISLLGTQRRLRGALHGHLAALELTSVGPMTRYLSAAIRLGLDAPVRRFYEVHIDANQDHGELAADVAVGGDTDVDGLDQADIAFGAAALLVVEDLFARHLLHAWAHERSSLLEV